MLRANMWTKTANENFEACSDAKGLPSKKHLMKKESRSPTTKWWFENKTIDFCVWYAMIGKASRT